MPGDSFSLAVFIGSEPYGLGFGGGFGEISDKVFLVIRYFVNRCEFLTFFYAEILF